ncbi:hypothetical protein C7377_1160 [Balneicella halophila]|uniref:Cell division protein ZapB n=1 Tax=Balneicella halophila TaxID=1537566 RepID=A0A7L4UQG9_BALHA|nr:hypothetical protein [Balneicella halophila]PVX50842.1 hypothetical protein C7377_1160 [Balneicella halophila]
MEHDESYLTDTIVEIKRMVLVLVTLNERLKERVSELELEKKSWDVEKEEMQNQLQQLQEDYNILKLAKAVQGDGESSEAKMQISKLMREIDQCMVLIQNL